MEDTTVLIVGGSGGIGRESAKLFAKSGAKVIIAARNKEKLDETVKSINTNRGKVYAIEVDATDQESVQSMANTIKEKYGEIDVLVNAFGQGLIQPFMDIDPKDAKEIIDVNVYGTFLVTQTVMGIMSEDGPNNVIMFPGTMGKYVMKNASVYAASKFAIQGFTKSLVEEQRRGNTKFSLLYLGGVNTAFWDDERVKMKVKKEAMLDPEEIAKVVFYAVSQPSASVMNEVVIQPESHQLV
ncbi:SDR family oxidoreductase [Gracilimonas mengyeensis]|uniref:NADP-dependent 3-hydroxy acid dehydrogenase YdfG n=1 Tax=Gracilimonas mengyeensis TaxID=1302730 RepID=A0A521BG17_9BACT|nr:SDR family oxidoreductase [Gracilimonas mengyeensis]SMO45660.1 NADP-dependent 3-hydroxy acid dehydrogenase YdfG [Gracilimonas mengyeensis]